MVQIDLGGKWEFRRTENWDAWLPAAVPGCVHTDLLASRLIDDPHVGLNELDVLWIDEADWEYRRTFRPTAAVLDHARQELVFDGLDTIAEVFLNGQSVGRADNMFRRWTFEVTGKLRDGDNELRVRFTGPVKEALRLQDQRRPLPGNRYSHWAGGRSRVTARNQIRKAQYQFGWDWGPMLATSGIWMPVRLVASSGPRIEYVTTQQRHADGQVTVAVTAHLRTPAPQRGTLAVRVGQAKASRPFRLRGDGKVGVEVTVEQPRLWWPAGQGDQPLYDLDVQVLDEAGRATDATRRKIGLRTVELVREPDAIGESFFLRINGRPIFCKGANWIPADLFPTRVSRDSYRYLLTQAVAGNMNMLRIWGGGIYENDDFYELCDELGLMVWHDHMFACAAYPASKDFLDNVAEEVRHQVRRLGTHPSIVLWCGNNENEQGIVEWGWTDGPDGPTLRREYQKLTQLEGKVTQAEAPQTPWWPSSASSGGDLQSPNSTDRGDCHFWEVWHRRKPFSRYLEIKPRFQSEFGFQSFPDAETMAPVLGPDDWNLVSPVMEHHQRSGVGNAVICETLCRHFRLPPKLEDFFYVSQLLQGIAIQMGVEHWRRIKPVCMGTIYWQLNDVWPVASWSSIDYAGRLKALHHAARRFYAPLLISAIEVEGRLELYVTSDLNEPLSGQWSLEVWGVDGKRRSTLGEKFTLDARESRKVGDWAIETFADGIDQREQVFLRLACKADGHSAENFWFPAAYKRYALERPKIKADVNARRDGALDVTLTSDAVALFVEAKTGKLAGDWSDNVVHLLPGKKRKLTFRPTKPASAAELKRSLAVRSLRDTY